MKTHVFVLLFLLGGGVPAATAADAPPPAVREMAAVEQFLGLSDAEEDAIVAFMLTLTDGSILPAP